MKFYIFKFNNPNNLSPKNIESSKIAEKIQDINLILEINNDLID
jgi:hypothetical protein